MKKTEDIASFADSQQRLSRSREMRHTLILSMADSFPFGILEVSVSFPTWR